MESVHLPSIPGLSSWLASEIYYRIRRERHDGVLATRLEASLMLMHPDPVSEQLNRPTRRGHPEVYKASGVKMLQEIRCTNSAHTPVCEHDALL